MSLLADNVIGELVCPGAVSGGALVPPFALSGEITVLD
jgi:hypothetical protein